MIVYTSTMNYNDSDSVDITVKSSVEGRIFAPTWNLVMDFKKGLISEDEYTNKYVKLMLESFNNNPNEWVKFLLKERVVFKCFCKSNSFCHRYILVEILKSICSTVEIHFEYRGEI